MADITRDASHIADVWPLKTKKHPGKAAVDIEAGQPLRYDANGLLNFADANGDAPANKYEGIAMQSVKAGQAVDFAEEGDFAGYDLSGLGYGDPVYVSNATGELSATPGTTSLLVGRVYAMSDPDRTKILHLSKV